MHTYPYPALHIYDIDKLATPNSTHAFLNRVKQVDAFESERTVLNYIEDTNYLLTNANTTNNTGITIYTICTGT